VLNGVYDLKLVQHFPEAMDLIESMIQADANHRYESSWWCLLIFVLPFLNRPSILEVKHHPFFWNPSEKVKFIHTISNRLKNDKKLRYIGVARYFMHWHLF
jgi:hypothetical protein